MCTSIVEIVPAEGMAKGSGTAIGDDWFKLTHTAVAYDHARQTYQRLLQECETE